MYPSPEYLSKLDTLVRNDLEDTRSLYFGLLLAFAGLVAVGVILEGPEALKDVREAFTELKVRWLRPIQTAFKSPLASAIPFHPQKESRLLKTLSFAGWFLICIGVTGEAVTEAIVARLDGQLQYFDSVLISSATRSASAAIGEAALAHVEASKNEKEAAQLRKDAEGLKKAAEDERMARVKLEKQLAPRVLSEQDMQAIADKLKAGGFDRFMRGRKVKVSSYSADADGVLFGLEIVDVLYRAGIESDSAVGRLVPVGLVNMGLQLTGPSQDQALMRLLVTELHGRLPLEKMDAAWDTGKYPDVSILVGVKTIAGFPTIIQSK
jgi:hypothetical protein